VGGKRKKRKKDSGWIWMQRAGQEKVAIIIITPPLKEVYIARGHFRLSSHLLFF
jgi:hypothetical protein